MTLVELLVVLAILALLTTVAVTSSDVVLSQGRHEATVRTLRAIEEAVLGPQNASATSDEPAAGFLADIGRLPRPPKGTTQAEGLAELWNRCSMVPYGISPASDTEVLVGRGWRGPYLRLPVGRSDLLDGWGHAFDLLDVHDHPVAVEQPIHKVRSLGADTNDPSDDLVLLLGIQEDPNGQVIVNRTDITVGGTVYQLGEDGQRQNPTGGGRVRVILYHPGGADDRLPEDTTAGGQLLRYTAPTTAGPRYLRAYLIDPDPEKGTRKSNIVRIQRGGVVDLEIR